jgi:hypothetical protein
VPEAAASETTPAATPVPTEQQTEALPPNAAATSTSWFARPPLSATVGAGDRQLRLTFYGFIQADFIHDTTRSYDDAIGSTLVARTDTFENTTGRTQFSTRNTRLGLLFESPMVAGVRPCSRATSSAISRTIRRRVRKPRFSTVRRSACGTPISSSKWTASSTS